MDKCCMCGRFCGYQADASTPFGNSSMLEPPDPEFYCKRCAKRCEDEAVARGSVYGDWMPADWQWRAAERLGWVRAGPKGAAWAEFFPPDKVPPGYVTDGHQRIAA